MKYLYIISTILIVLVFVSCKQEVGNETIAENQFIEIPKAQFQSENMQLGKLEKTVINEQISFTGTIVSGINGMAKIIAPVPGKVVSVQIRNGQNIKANETLIWVGGIELIDLQQAFASSSAKIRQLKSDYDRAKQLFDENIKTEADFMLAESNYKVELANYSALKVKLQNIGLNLADIENGQFASQYGIRSPVTGQVSGIKIVKGQYLNTDTEIAEITDNNNKELHIIIFEKDFPKIKTGQMVHFWGISDNQSISHATIRRIGGKLDPNTNTIDCYASIDDKTGTFAINQMVNGEIIVSSDTVSAVPQSAVFPIGNNHYVLIKKSEDNNTYRFEKKKIKTGKSSDDFIEISGISDEEILISGTYNLSIE